MALSDFQKRILQDMTVQQNRGSNLQTMRRPPQRPAAQRQQSGGGRGDDQWRDLDMASAAATVGEGAQMPDTRGFWGKARDRALGGASVLLQPLQHITIGGRAVTLGLEEMATTDNRVVSEIRNRAMQADQGYNTLMRMIQMGEDQKGVNEASVMERLMDPTYGFGRITYDTGNPWIDNTVGFAGDVALDPITYVTAGTFKATGYATRAAHAAVLRAKGAPIEVWQNAAKYGPSHLPAYWRQEIAVRRAGLFFPGNLYIPGTKYPGMAVERSVARMRAAITSNRLFDGVGRARVPSYLKEAYGALLFPTARSMRHIRETDPDKAIHALELVAGAQARRQGEQEFSNSWGRFARTQLKGMDGDSRVALTHAIESGARVPVGATATAGVSPAARGSARQIDPNLPPEVQAWQEVFERVLKQAQDEGLDYGDIANKLPDNISYVPHMRDPKANLFLSDSDTARRVLGDELFEDLTKSSGRGAARHFGVVPGRKYKLGNGIELVFETGTIREMNEKWAAAVKNIDGAPPKLYEDDFAVIFHRYINDVAHDIGIMRMLRGWADADAAAVAAGGKGTVRTLSAVVAEELDEIAFNVNRGSYKKLLAAARKAKAAEDQRIVEEKLRQAAKELNPRVAKAVAETLGEVAGDIARVAGMAGKVTVRLGDEVVEFSAEGVTRTTVTRSDDVVTVTSKELSDEIDKITAAVAKADKKIVDGLRANQAALDVAEENIEQLLGDLRIAQLEVSAAQNYPASRSGRTADLDRMPQIEARMQKLQAERERLMRLVREGEEAQDQLETLYMSMEMAKTLSEAAGRAEIEPQHLSELMNALARKEGLPTFRVNEATRLEPEQGAEFAAERLRRAAESVRQQAQERTDRAAAAAREAAEGGPSPQDPRWRVLRLQQARDDMNVEVRAARAELNDEIIPAVVEARARRGALEGTEGGRFPSGRVVQQSRQQLEVQSRGDWDLAGADRLHDRLLRESGIESDPVVLVDRNGNRIVVDNPHLLKREDIKRLSARGTDADTGAPVGSGYLLEDAPVRAVPSGTAGDAPGLMGRLPSSRVDRGGRRPQRRPIEDGELAFYDHGEQVSFPGSRGQRGADVRYERLQEPDVERVSSRGGPQSRQQVDAASSQRTGKVERLKFGEEIDRMLAGASRLLDGPLSSNNMGVLVRAYQMADEERAFSLARLAEVDVAAAGNPELAAAATERLTARAVAALEEMQAIQDRITAALAQSVEEIDGVVARRTLTNSVDEDAWVAARRVHEQNIELLVADAEAASDIAWRVIRQLPEEEQRYFEAVMRLQGLRNQQRRLDAALEAAKSESFTGQGDLFRAGQLNRYADLLDSLADAQRGTYRVVREESLEEIDYVAQHLDLQGQLDALSGVPRVQLSDGLRAVVRAAPERKVTGPANATTAVSQGALEAAPPRVRELYSEIADRVAETYRQVDGADPMRVRQLNERVAMLWAPVRQLEDDLQLGVGPYVGRRQLQELDADGNVVMESAFGGRRQSPKQPADVVADRNRVVAAERAAREEVLNDLRAGKYSWEEFATSEMINHPLFRNVKLADVLGAMPGMHPLRAQRELGRLGIRPNRRFSKLTAQENAKLREGIPWPTRRATEGVRKDALLDERAGLIAGQPRLEAAVREAQSRLDQALRDVELYRVGREDALRNIHRYEESAEYLRLALSRERRPRERKKIQKQIKRYESKIREANEEANRLFRERMQAEDALPRLEARVAENTDMLNGANKRIGDLNGEIARAPERMGAAEASEAVEQLKLLVDFMERYHAALRFRAEKVPSSAATWGMPDDELAAAVVREMMTLHHKRHLDKLDTVLNSIGHADVPAGASAAQRAAIALDPSAPRRVDVQARNEAFADWLVDQLDDVVAELDLASKRLSQMRSRQRSLERSGAVSAQELPSSQIPKRKQPGVAGWTDKKALDDRFFQEKIRTLRARGMSWREVTAEVKKMRRGSKMTQARVRELASADLGPLRPPDDVAALQNLVRTGRQQQRAAERVFDPMGRRNVRGGRDVDERFVDGGDLSPQGEARLDDMVFSGGSRDDLAPAARMVEGEEGVGRFAEGVGFEDVQGLSVRSTDDMPGAITAAGRMEAEEMFQEALEQMRSIMFHATGVQLSRSQANELFRGLVAAKRGSTGKRASEARAFARRRLVPYAQQAAERNPHRIANWQKDVQGRVHQLKAEANRADRGRELLSRGGEATVVDRDIRAFIIDQLRAAGTLAAPGARNVASDIAFLDMGKKSGRVLYVLGNTDQQRAAFAAFRASDGTVPKGVGIREFDRKEAVAGTRQLRRGDDNNTQADWLDVLLGNQHTSMTLNQLRRPLQEQSDVLQRLYDRAHKMVDDIFQEQRQTYDNWYMESANRLAAAEEAVRVGADAARRLEELPRGAGIRLGRSKKTLGEQRQETFDKLQDQRQRLVDAQAERRRLIDERLELNAAGREEVKRLESLQDVMKSKDMEIQDWLRWAEGRKKSLEKLVTQTGKLKKQTKLSKTEARLLREGEQSPQTLSTLTEYRNVLDNLEGIAGRSNESIDTARMHLGLLEKELRDALRANKTTKYLYDHVADRAKEIGGPAALREFLTPMKRMLAQGWEELDQVYALAPGERVAIRSELATMMRNMDSVFGDNGFLRAWGEMNQFFKTYATATPGFHVRNATSAMFLNFSDGVTIGSHVQAARLYRKYDMDPVGFWTDPSVTKIERQAMEAALSTGMGGRFSADELGVQAGRGKLHQNAFTRFSRYAGEHVEGTVRLAAALHTRRQAEDFVRERFATRGADATRDSLRRTHEARLTERLGRKPTMNEIVEAEIDLLFTARASSRIRRLHFDYGEASNFDRGAKLLFPFWTFMSRNIPLQLSQMYTKPRMFAAYENFVKNFRVDDPNDPTEMPNWMRRRGGFVASRSGLGGYNTVLMPDLQHIAMRQDLELMSSPSGVLSATNPFFRLPLEQIAGERFFMNRPYDGVGDRLESIAEGIWPTLGQGKRLTGQGQADGRVAQSWLNYFGLPIRQIDERVLRQIERENR